MSRKYTASSKFQTGANIASDRRRQIEAVKQVPKPRKITNNSSSSIANQSFSKTIRNVKNDRPGNKEPLPPITTSISNFNNVSNDADKNEQDFEINFEDSLLLKLFDGKKQSLNELNEESMSYIWLRRIKEIFLHMTDGKDDQDNDLFVDFDMNLARIDLINTCDRYIENERLALNKKDTKAQTSTKTNQQNSSLQNVQSCIKELNDRMKNPSSGDLSSLLNKCINSLQELDKTTQDIINKLRKQPTNNSSLDIRTIMELIRSLEIIEKQKDKNDLEKRQEWDMKKLYAEVFKISYKRNRLKTARELEDLTPKKKGDDQPNFSNAIWWYSCDKANIYYQINSTLCLENYELLMSYRYYLNDLCRMIEFMYKRRKEEYGDIAQTFYRGGYVSKSQLTKMSKQQKGQLISLLGFFSTTTDIEIAKDSARKQQISKDNERVLFQIKIEPQTACTAFAYIQDISFHPEEKEVLFSMGSTFIVDNVKKPTNTENYHTIHLTATDIDKTLLDDIRNKIENCSPSGRAVLLAQYLVELGEYRVVRRYLNSLLTQACDGGILINDPTLTFIYFCLGKSYARQNLYGDAIKAFKQALNTQARLEYSNNNILADIHTNIGLAYISLGHFNEAEEILVEALRIQLRELNANQQHLAAIYSNIGYVYYKKNFFTESEEAFIEAEKIYKKNSSKFVRDTLEQSLIKAEYLLNYGHLLGAYKSLEEAQKRYNEALKLYKSILFDSDPKLMKIHIDIILAYIQNENYDTVTKWYEDLRQEKTIEKQEMNMFELNSSVTQANLAFLHELVGACYAEQNLFKDSIHFWSRAFIIKRKTRLEQLFFETTHDTSSNLISEQRNFIKKNYSRTREYYLKLQKKMNETNSNDEVQLSNDFCLGLLYAESYKCNDALPFLTKALQTLEQSNKNMLFVAYLLLADMFKYEKKYQEAINNFNAALKLLDSLDYHKDHVLETEITLARSDCLIYTDKNDAIYQLEKLVNSLKSHDNDKKRINLKIIVYDTLAQYYLKGEKYDLFDNIVEISTTLKRRSLSQYHPSLAINFILIAERLIQQNQYREALDFYERALEIQSLNLSSNHPKIKKIYYAIGDTYCKLDKIENAKEKYNIAENSNDPDILPEDFIKSEEPLEIFMARISMHLHLAEYYKRKQVYKEAILEMDNIVDLLKERLPTSAFDLNDDTILIQKNFTDASVISNLKQLANCYMHLGDIMNVDQEDEYGYKAAYDIYLKLFENDEESVKENYLEVNRKLSAHYEKLDENEEALKFLEKTIDLEKATIFTLYRLASLNTACDKLDDAMENYETILSDPSLQGKKVIETIVRDKNDEIKKKQERKRRSSTSDESNNNAFNNVSGNASPQRHRNLADMSVASLNEDATESKTKIKAPIGNAFDNRTMATAHIQLGDIDKAIKFYEKDIKERRKKMKDTNIFKEQLEKIEQGGYMYKQQAILIVLPKVFHSLITNIRETGTFENSNILELADSHFQCALLHDQRSCSLDSLINYISALGIYFLKSTNDINHLIGDMTNLINSFIARTLKSEEIMKICKPYLPSKDLKQLHLKIAAMYRDVEMNDVIAKNGDGDINNESRLTALEWYRSLFEITDDVLIKGVCYYNILTLYKDFIYEDDVGKAIVVCMIPWLRKFTTSDQRLLVELASKFLKEFDNNKDNSDMKTNRQLQDIAKSCLSEKLEVNDAWNVGKYLVECNDLNSAKRYWKSIVEQLESDIPHRILLLLHDPSSTLEQILHVIKQLDNETIELFQQLIKIYEIIADYYVLDGKNSQRTNTSTEWIRQAETKYKMAIHLLKRLKTDTNKINEIEKKQRELSLQQKH